MAWPTFWPWPKKLEATLILGNLISEQIQNLLAELNPSIAIVQAKAFGAGAGFFLDEQGHLLTNAHVVGRERLARICLFNGQGHNAEVIARDHELDLAVLLVEGGPFSPATLGDSTRLAIGELVFTLGHPWGFTHSTTSGVVSALSHASSRGRRGLIPIIRTDALLAPGNSGGPLLNAKGEVIGVNTMIVGGNQGVAIPSAVIKDYLMNDVKISTETTVLH